MSSNPGENAGKKSQIFLARTFGARDVSTGTLLGRRAKYEPLAGPVSAPTFNFRMLFVHGGDQ